MKIGIIIGRIGDVDGVALETEKWIKVLHQMGHEIFILSGRFKKSIVGESKEILIPVMSFFSPECEWEQNNAFLLPPNVPSELLNHLNKVSEDLATKMFKWIKKNNIDIILVENASALPTHLSMGMAIKHLVQNTGIPTVCHDHDFYWERGDRYKTRFPEVEKIIKDTFPLCSPHAKHAVINTHAQKTLKEKYNINAVMVPNVMDFNIPFGEKDSYNFDLPGSIGLNKNDIPLFQVTRIVRRKGIETALELIHQLDDKKVKLVITGSAVDDNRKEYYNDLIEIIKKYKLNKRVAFGHNKILNCRGQTQHGEKIYSLSDAYAHATASTYFSSYEGFGNAFVEAILAKTPIFVNNYKPVYWPDIGSKGFKAVMIEDNKLTDEAITQIDNIIHDKNLQEEISEHNYNLGKLFFSFDVLREKLEVLF